jgi:hypothetical protein
MNKDFTLLEALSLFSGVVKFHPISDIPMIEKGKSNFYRYHKQNQRKHRKEMRRTVFANRHIHVK